MDYKRMAIEEESPEEVGAEIRYNLSESAIADQSLASLGIAVPADLVLTYTEHLGSRRIREHVAASSRGAALGPDDVLVTAGASTSLFIVATALLGARDHVVVARPNYATNLETPRAIGCAVSHVDLAFEAGFRLELDQVAAAIRPGTTRLISVCSPNNPTGTRCSDEQLRRLADLARDHGCYLLIDETYADLTYPAPRTGSGQGADDADTAADEELEAARPLAAAGLGDHVIGVSSMSKVYGVPGIRIGWLTTTNKSLQRTFLAAKEQISISGSVVDEYIAEQILARRPALRRQTMADMARRRARVAAWVEAERDRVEWVFPEAGVMCFVRMKQTPPGGTAAFYRRLLADHGAYVGPGRWFERDDTFFRLGYGWPTWEHLELGLQALSQALRG